MKIAWLYKRITDALDTDCPALKGLPLLIVPWHSAHLPDLYFSIGCGNITIL